MLPESLDHWATWAGQRSRSRVTEDIAGVGLCTVVLVLASSSYFLCWLSSCCQPVGRGCDWSFVCVFHDMLEQMIVILQMIDCMSKVVPQKWEFDSFHITCTEQFH